MRTQRITSRNQLIRNAIAELEGLITARYPEAIFEVEPGEDPEGIYLRATVDVEDTDEVVDTIIDQLLDIQVEQRLPVSEVWTLGLMQRPQNGARRPHSGRGDRCRGR